MKTLLFSLSLLTLALLAFAWPPAPASGTTQRDEPKKARREGDDSAGATAARPTTEHRPASNATGPKASTRKATAGKVTAGKATAGKATAGKAAAKRPADANAKRDVPISSAMEAEVIAFVREHHRELVDVLAHLQDNVPREYERAVRELSRQRHRLQQLEGRERYAAELRLWKAQSRVRLLGAKVQMGNNESLNNALREKLAEVYDLRASLLKRDRERTAERLAKLDEQLQTLRDSRETTLEKQLLTLTKAAQRRKKSVKTTARNAKPAPGTKRPAKKSSQKTID